MDIVSYQMEIKREFLSKKDLIIYRWCCDFDTSSLAGPWLLFSLFFPQMNSEALASV